MDENNIIKKKKNNNYYRRHHNHNRKYYKNQKKKNLILDLNDTGEIRNIMTYNQNTEPVVENILLVNEQTKTENDLVLNQEQELNNIVENNVDYDEPVVPLKKTKTRTKLSINNKYLKYGATFAILLVAIFSTSYSYFNYTKEDERQADIVAGEVYVKLVENSTTITLDKMYPREDSEARERNDNYFDFTIKGKNTSLSKAVIYSINISDGESVSGKTRIDPDYIKVDLQEKINNNYEYILNGVTLNDFDYSSFVPINTTSEITKEYRLRIWVGDNVLIGDTSNGATHTQTEFNNLFATYKISIDSRDMKPGVTLVNTAISDKQTAATNSCNPIWIDNMGTESDASDDIKYFTGDNSCVDMNYVWYSGKLWRITAIYPDGSMKLITNNPVTTIQWGSSIEYNGSWVYQWLNEDFYDTLNNVDGIVKTSTWNYTTSTSISTRPETLANQKTVNAKVGLLNVYEYYNSYRCINSETCTGSEHSDGYLKNGKYSWLITPYDSTRINNYLITGATNYNLPKTTLSVHPSIVLNTGIELTGSGTITDPYLVAGDKKAAESNSLLVNRSSGEYVKFNNELYRIVETNKTLGTTKIISVDYLKNSGTVVKKYFGSTTIYGKSSNTQSDDYWDYYLNHTWYNSIPNTYKKMIVNDTYYLGVVFEPSHYKSTICSDANLDTVTTKTCTKYTSNDVDKTYTGKIGLPRIGELFASQGSDTAADFLTLTPYDSVGVGYIRNISDIGQSRANRPTSGQTAVRPTFTLKRGIKITSGTGYVGGNTNSPFEISE